LNILKLLFLNPLSTNLYSNTMSAFDDRNFLHNKSMIDAQHSVFEEQLTFMVNFKAWLKLRILMSESLVKRGNI